MTLTSAAADRLMITKDVILDQSRRRMAAVRQKHTSPELRVRAAAHRLGYRYRLHRSDLPGTPDLVFPRLRKVLFVHGCFWHRHAGCRKATMPRTRVEFWRQKFEANVARDGRNEAQLSEQGWQVLIVWECEAADSSELEKRLLGLLGSPLIA